MNKITGIYKITNNINNKVYIGQSWDIAKRWRLHIQKSKTDRKHLYRAFQKYGIDNFKFEIVKEIKDIQNTQKLLDIYEKIFIDIYNSLDKNFGYNIRQGGSRGKHSRETRKKMSESAIGRKFSEETRKKMSEAKIGSKLSKKHIEKLISVHRGKIVSEETRKKMSESAKGKKVSEESRKKISMKLKGIPLSAETRKKMSESQRKRFSSLGSSKSGDIHCDLPNR